LKKNNLLHWIWKRRPHLTAKHVAVRLAWCTVRKNWTVDKWGRIIYSDECSLERGAGRRPQWVWGYTNEKYTNSRIKPVKKGRDISYMIWGAIWIGGRSDIVFIERDESSPRGGYTGWSYLQVLRDQRRTIWSPGMKLQQDNASIHTDKCIAAWLKKYKIEIEEWPSNSPDLSPIEHIWKILKDRINTNYPGLLDMGKSKKAYKAFQRAIRVEWAAIDQDLIDGLIKSMDNRVNAVLAAKGWHTRY